MLTMPHVAENIISSLDFKTLLHWRTLSHAYKDFIDNNQSVWKSRFLEEVDKKYRQSWNNLVEFLDANQLRKMAMLSYKIGKYRPETTYFNPILSAIEIDDTDMFKTFWQVKNPDEIIYEYMMTAILWLVDEWDNLDIFIILFEYVSDHYDEEDLIEAYTMSLETSIFKNQIKICEYLSDFYGQNCLKMAQDSHPLLTCAELNNFDFFKKISEKFQDINPIHTNGTSALHLAGKHGSLEFFKFIFERTKETNLVNQDGYTPLRFAVERGHFEICKLIAESGRCLKLKDNKAKSKSSLRPQAQQSRLITRLTTRLTRLSILTSLSKPTRLSTLASLSRILMVHSASKATKANKTFNKKTNIFTSGRAP